MIISIARELQIPLLAALLLGGFATKLVRTLRVGSLDAGLGPTALFQKRLRQPIALGMCALELGLGVGLIATAGPVGRGGPAICVRLGTTLLFLVALCALLELRTARPEVGCGCFGELSTTPVSWRTLARAALLALVAASTILAPPIRQPAGTWQIVTLLVLLAVELALIAGLSPELGEALVRLGYSEPCELRVVPTERTLAALRRSKQWRRHAGLLSADLPSDVWRELCWRYLVFPGRYGDREADVVFGVFLRHRRPLVRVALIDTLTGAPIQWPAAPGRPGWRGPAVVRPLPEPASVQHGPRPSAAR
jgi:hypothetical protein